MNTDELLREAFQGLENRSNGLDPARVIAGAKRRRVRRIAAAATASATLAAAVATAVAVYPANEPAPVAGWSAADSLPVIKNREWTQLTGGPEWFYIDGRSWKLGDPPGTKEWAGIAEGLPEHVAEETWFPVVGGVDNHWSTFIFLPADIIRVHYTVRGRSKTFEIEANVFRLESAPEWVLAFSDFPASGPVTPNGAIDGGFDVAVKGFDAAGKLVLRCEPPGQTSKTAPAKPVCRRVR